MKDGFTCFTTAGSSWGSECGSGACRLLNIFELVYQVAFEGNELHVPWWHISDYKGMRAFYAKYTTYKDVKMLNS